MENKKEKIKKKYILNEQILRKYTTMILILDGYSEIDAHVCSEANLFKEFV